MSGAQGYNTAESRKAFNSNYQESNQRSESFSTRGGEETRRTFESSEEVHKTRSSRPTLDDCDLVLRQSTLIITLRSSDTEPTEIDLDEHVGNLEGELVWGSGGFSETSDRLRLDGTFLLASCAVSGSAKVVAARLNLDDHIVYMAARRRFEPVPADPELVQLMASPDWMNFTVITRPDMAAFLRNPAFQNAISGVARRAVDEVMAQIREEMMRAVEEAVKKVSQESEQFVESEMEALIKKATKTAAYTGLAQLTVMQPRQKRAYNRFAPYISAAPITEEVGDSDSESG